MTSMAKRKITAKAAVFFWASSGIKKIVIADATGQTLLNDADLLLLSQMNVQVEQIHYEQDTAAILELGKGYGEGELIKFALENSVFLQDQPDFYKCTGKVYCRNFSAISGFILKNNIKNIFWKDAFNNFIDTRFFYTSNIFCTTHILPAYKKVNDKINFWAEHSIFEMARQELVRQNSPRPLLTGFSGSNDQLYFDASLGFLDTNYPCWFSR